MRKLLIALVIFGAFSGVPRAQEITTQTPIHSTPGFDPAKPTMTIHASSNQTGNLFEFYNPAGELVCYVDTAGTLHCPGGSGTGTVTNFSAGTLSPLFTTSVASPTTTPSLTFAQSTAAAETIYGNDNGSAAMPAFQPLSGWNIPVYAGAVTAGDCVKWNAAYVLADAGAVCGSGGGGMAIGGAVSGGTSASLLYVGPSGVLAQDESALNWNDTSKVMTLEGTIEANNFITLGTGAGYTAWTSGPISPGASGTVTCGANANSQFVCSFNGGPVTLMPTLANDLGGTDPTNPQVVGFHLVGEGQAGDSPITFAEQNDIVTGTTQYTLAKILMECLGGVGCVNTPYARILTTADTSIPAYMTASATSILGNARLAGAGSAATCMFDGAGTAGDYVIASSTVAGDCHDAGATAPTSGWVVGQLMTTFSSGGSTGIVKALGFNAAAGSSITFQVNGTSTASQSTINFQSGGGMAVTNPSAGNVLIAEAPRTMFFSGQEAGSIDSVNAANVVTVSGFYLPYPVTFSHIEFIVSTPDGSNNYDVGIYTHAGVLEADIGAMTMPTPTSVDKATVQGAVTLPIGQYYIAVTGNAAVANFSVSSCGTFYGEAQGNLGSSTGGALPSSFTPPADTFSSWQNCIVFGIH